MYLYRMLYYSRAVNDPDTDAILDVARKKNAKNFLTGALWYDGEFFVQVLEGTRSSLAETYRSISQDNRHRDVVLVECIPIDERSFSDWDMDFYHDNKTNRANIKRYVGQDYLDPRAMSPNSMLKMLKSLNPTLT
jgi:hypothetical protein